MEHQEVLRVLRALQDAGVEYMLIGAMAMGLHGVVRATEDVDMLVRADKENIERIRAALRVAYPQDPFVEEIQSDDLLGDYAVVRYCPPSGGYYFDFIARLGEMGPTSRSSRKARMWRGFRSALRLHPLCIDSRKARLAP